MRVKAAIALLVLWSVPFFANAQAVTSKTDDTVSKGTVQRLEFVHYKTATNSVEWGVADGNVENGEFVPQGQVKIYSINLETGVMTHDGEDGKLTDEEASSALRAFGVLSQLIQAYTDNWNGNEQPVSGESDGSPAASVSRITLHARSPKRPATSGHHHDGRSPQTAAQL